MDSLVSSSLPTFHLTRCERKEIMEGMNFLFSFIFFVRVKNYSREKILVLFLLILVNWNCCIVIVLSCKIWESLIENKSSSLHHFLKLKKKKKKKKKKKSSTKRNSSKKTAFGIVPWCDYIIRGWFHYRNFHRCHHFVYSPSFLHKWKRWNVEISRGGSEGGSAFPDVCIHADDILGGPSIMGTTLIRNFDYTKICSPGYRSGEPCPDAAGLSRVSVY